MTQQPHWTHPESYVINILNTLLVLKRIYEQEQPPSIEVFNAPGKFNIPVYRVTGRRSSQKVNSK